MEPVLDFHTHAQNVFGMCCVPRALRPLLRTGLARLYEKTGFHPAMKRIESPFAVRQAAREMQSRFASFTFEDYLRAMKRNGIAYACALPVEPMARTQDLLSSARGHREVIPFASVRFDDGDPAAQIDAHLAAGCKGLKIHPVMQDVAPDDPRVVAVFERLRGTDVPVLFHTGRMSYFLGRRPERPELAEPARLRPLLARFPKQPVVLGHMGLLHAGDALELATDHPSVYLEVSFQPVSVVREALRRVGVERLLFGSDWPATEPRTEIAIVRKAVGAEPGALRRILFENGAELLRRTGWEP